MSRDVLEEVPQPWRRDISEALRCKCGHLDSEHRPDLKTSSPCGRGGCGCQHLRPEFVVFFEHRVVLGRLA
jgi:hypothetical protein